MLTIGVIGGGRIGKLHIDNLLNMKNIHVKSLADISLENIEEWASTREIDVLTTDPQDIINDEEIDAVIICSPTATHLPLIKAAAEAGKHIFCEKPLSDSIHSSKEALEVVKRQKVKLQLGFNRRFDENFRTVKERITQGAIGNVYTTRIISRDPEPPSADYIKNSGGLFKDMMIHDFDMARYIVQSEIVEVQAKGTVLIDSRIGDLKDIDTAIVLLTFENGSIGTIENSRKAVFGYDQRLEVFGEKGALVVNNEQPTTIELYSELGIQTDRPHLFFLERYKEAYISEMKEFISAIINDQAVLCSGYDGLQAELIAEAANESLVRGKPVKIHK